MYTKNIEILAKKHMSIQLYADDIQCYFDFDSDNNSLIEIVQNKIKNFIVDLKLWMNTNYLKLDESKTKVAVLQPPYKHASDLKLNILIDGCKPIAPSTQV